MKVKSIIYRMVYTFSQQLAIVFHNIKNWWLKRKIPKYAGSVSVNLLSSDVRSSCLCSIQYGVGENAVPCSTGYLFHSYPKCDSSLYFVEALGKEPLKIAEVSFNLLDYNISLSPSGFIIATPIAKRGCLFVINDGVERKLFNNEGAVQPCGWLYNTGIDFSMDESGKEFCVFAEYGHSESEYYVWRGIAPYNDEALWERVLMQRCENDIHHFHQVRRDPWTNIIYLTSGDNESQNKWWYSKDNGKSFNLFNSVNICNVSPNVLRMTNFVFTEKCVYWVTDSAKSHSINRIERREEDGILDVESMEQLTSLPYGQATNAVCYLEKLNALFLYERVAWSASDFYQKQLKGRFTEYIYLIDDDSLYSLMDIKNEDGKWGGHRGKCYQLYNRDNNNIIMGFSYDTPCIMTNFGSNYKNAGSIIYNFKN